MTHRHAHGRRATHLRERGVVAERRAHLGYTARERCSKGHQPIAVVVKALRETYLHLHGGGSVAELKSRMATPDEMERVVQAGQYEEWRKQYLL